MTSSYTYPTQTYPELHDEYTDRELAAEATCWNLTPLPYSDAVEVIAAHLDRETSTETR